MPDLALQFEAKAERIAESLKLALFYRPAAARPHAGMTDAMPLAKLPAGLVGIAARRFSIRTRFRRGLRREHRTAAGVWGLIAVLEGRLRFRPLRPIGETVLTPDTPMAVAPQEPHEVAPDGPVRFYVEFYRAADLASLDTDRA